MEKQKASGKPYKMKDLIERTGLSRQVLHNYVVLGLIGEAGRTKGGHRYFHESVFDRVALIRQMQEQGYTLQFLVEMFRYKP